MRILALVTAAALVLAPQTTPTAIGPARALLAQGDTAGARQLLLDITAAEPEHATAWLLLGLAEQRHGDLDAALAATETALALGGAGPTGDYRLAIVHGARGDLDGAFARLLEVKAANAYNLTNIALDPDAAALQDDPRWDSLFPDAAAFANPFVEPARILHDVRGEVANGQFGWIAREIGDVDGDGVQDFTTSAPTDGNGGTVFTYSSGTAKLLWQVHGEPNAQLGSGLEAAGDVNADGIPDVIAGAPTGNYALVLSGRDGEVIWRLNAEGENEGFGTQVGDVGDLNGDGHADVVVGAPTADRSGEDAGRVYVFSGRDGSVLWSADGQAPGERLGSTVAGGTVGGDSWIVGGADQGQTGGIAYLWKGLATDAAFRLDPLPSAVAVGGMFASIPGDVDGDGVAEMYVSDWGDSTSGPATGRIYVMSGATGEIVHTIAGENAGDGFGIGPADAGDVDGDGHADLIIGAWQYAGAAPSGGRAYLYSGRTGELLWQLTSHVMGETFAFDATGIGDVDGDGAVDFLFTSAWSSANGPRTGRVLIVAGPRLN
jgi:hypothetical protein